MAEEKEIFKKTRIFFFILFFVSLLLLAINFSGIKRDFVVFLVNPLNEAAFNSSGSVVDVFTVFSQMRSLREDYYILKEELLILKTQEEKSALLVEENALLRRQIGLDEEQEDLVLAEVLYEKTDWRMENLLLNKGSEDGIGRGDIAVLGDIFIGTVVETTPKTSKVRLPTSRASSLKVMILEQDAEEEMANFLNGIALGYSNKVSVENIELVRDLQVGDPVIINDPKIGEYLYLGKIYSLGEDPTLTFKAVDIKLPVDYQSLKYIFVRKGQ
jgi:rod shape-determining protein MreC